MIPSERPKRKIETLREIRVPLRGVVCLFTGAKVYLYNCIGRTYFFYTGEPGVQFLLDSSLIVLGEYPSFHTRIQHLYSNSLSFYQFNA